MFKIKNIPRLLLNFAFFFPSLPNCFSPTPNILSQELIGPVYSQSLLTSDFHFHSWFLKRQKLLFLEVTFLNEATCYFIEVQMCVCVGGCFSAGSVVKNLPTMQKMRVWSLGQEDAPE